MNKRIISFKIDGYTINLHRGKEEAEEIKQKRMALFMNCLCNIAMQPMVKYFEEYYPELQIDITNIILKNIYKKNIKSLYTKVLEVPFRNYFMLFFNKESYLNAR